MSLIAAVICVTLLQNAYLVTSQIIIVDLDSGWTTINSNNSISVPATVPGNIYSDLENSNILNDSYYRFNDIDYRWVAYDNWTYTTNFDVSAEVLSKQFVFLVANGLDTVAAVSVNGVLLANTDNMFVRYRWEIKQHLLSGTNTLTIQFTSPVTYALSQQESYVATYGYDVGPSCTPTVQHGECHANFIRKIQSQFSWDWGPAFPTMGIWQPIKLEAVDSCTIRDVLVYPENTGSGWDLSVGVYFDCSTTESQTGTVDLVLSTSPTWSISTPVFLQPDSSRTAFINITGSIPTDRNISLWWPNGYGQPTLYNLSVSFTNDVNEPSSRSVRVGFRTVELVQDVIESGNTFYFKINGVPVFIKGSNWIPADSFINRVTEDVVRNLLQSAADVHMNGLRVWGGGLYESDMFYDISDELGILIWQDLMFACAMYPVNDNFINSVKTEVTQQVRRLQRHPSVLLWSGNNENEAALAQNWYNTQNNYNQYYSDYLKLYVNTSMVIAKAEDTSRPFITSSPSNGVESIAEGYVASNPQNTLYGDVHFYTYDDDGWNWQVFPRPRFASEFGFQSWPSFETLAKVSIEEDWDWVSSFIDSRQHHDLGNAEIAAAIQQHMNLPTGCIAVEPVFGSLSSSLSSIWGSIRNVFTVQRTAPYHTCQTVDGFKGILYQSQITQAMSIKTESEGYRRGRSELINGEGFTMGALYWQLDDVWQGASWASIEYGGKWKVLHYYAAKFFAPVLVSPYVSANNTLVTYIASDTNDQTSATLEINVYKWDSFTATNAISVPVSVTPNSAVKVHEVPVDQLYQSANCSPEQCFFYVLLKDSSSGQQISPENYIYPTSFFNVAGLVKANIAITNVASTGPTTFTIDITSDNVAPFVWLEATGIKGRFSDNGFLLVDPTLRLEFYAWESVTASQLAASLSVLSLMDLY